MKRIIDNFCTKKITLTESFSEVETLLCICATTFRNERKMSSPLLFTRSLHKYSNKYLYRKKQQSKMEVAPRYTLLKLLTLLTLLTMLPWFTLLTCFTLFYHYKKYNYDSSSYAPLLGNVLFTQNHRPLNNNCQYIKCKYIIHQSPLSYNLFFKLYILYQYYKEPSMVFECVPVSGSLKLFA